MKVYSLHSSFSASAYDLPIPAIDGRKAQKISVRFSGSCFLDRTSEDDLVFLNAMRMGTPVRLIITGLPTGKGFSLRTRDTDDELSYHCSLRVEAVELAEPT